MRVDLRISVHDPLGSLRSPDSAQAPVTRAIDLPFEPWVGLEVLLAAVPGSCGAKGGPAKVAGAPISPVFVVDRLEPGTADGPYIAHATRRCEDARDARVTRQALLDEYGFSELTL